MSFISTLCVRCGSPRVYKGELEKEIETLLGKTTVLVTYTVCPDSDCQKLVDIDLEEKRIKQEEKMLAHKQRGSHQRPAPAI
jgi:hypothetical protein